jgi:hypothetical protein
VRVDTLNVVDRLTWKSSEAEPDRHDDLTDDDEVVSEKEVVVLANSPADEVLDRHDARTRRPLLDRLEDLAEAANCLAGDVSERRQRGVFGERSGFAGVGYRPNPACAALGRAEGRLGHRPDDRVERSDGLFSG